MMLSQARFGALAGGLSQAAVSKAIAAGKLVATAEGLDPDEPTNAAWARTHRAGFSTPGRRMPSGKAGPEPPAIASLDDVLALWSDVEIDPQAADIFGKALAEDPRASAQLSAIAIALPRELAELRGEIAFALRELTRLYERFAELVAAIRGPRRLPVAEPESKVAAE
jgi:hypothetical protein